MHDGMDKGPGTARREQGRDAPRAVVLVPMPRVVMGRSRLQRRPETVAFAVVDDVPVAVPSVRGDDAPVTLRLHAGNGWRRETWRSFGGALYRPFLCDHDAGASPAEAAARMRARMRHHLGLPDAAGGGSWSGHEQVFDYMGLLDRADRASGIASPEERGFRSVADDGLDARPGQVRAAGDNLMLVDGRLHHRAPVPGYRVHGISGGPSDFRLDVACPYSATPGYVRRASDAPWAAFGPDRADEAEAFYAAVGAKGWAAAPSSSGLPRRFEVAEPALLAEAAPDPGHGAFVLGCLGEYVDLCGPGVHGLSDEGVAAYLDARRARSAGDPVAALAAIRALAEFAAADLPARSGRPHPYAAAGLALLLREDRFERPRRGLDPSGWTPEAGDEEALASLAPGGTP